MSIEPESYRDNLEMLLEAFPDKKLLAVCEVAKWSGKDRRFIKANYFGDKKVLSLAELARKIS